MAREAGCEFDVSFSRPLWDRCQAAPRGPGLWNMEFGILCSLSISAATVEPSARSVHVKSAGERFVVLILWACDDGRRRVFVSLPHSANDNSPLQGPRATNGQGANPSSVTCQLHIPWYLVCASCNAKWFAESRRARCPRCRVSCQTEVQARPPWWNANDNTLNRQHPEVPNAGQLHMD